MAYKELDRWAQLNVLVDKIAKKRLSNFIRNQSRQGSKIQIPYYDCIISNLSNSDTFEPISSHLAESVCNNIQANNLKDYWKGKKKLSETAFSKIDWKSLDKSAKNYERLKWLSKFVTGICGIG